MAAGALGTHSTDTHNRHDLGPPAAALGGQQRHRSEKRFYQHPPVKHPPTHTHTQGTIWGRLRRLMDGSSGTPVGLLLGGLLGRVTGLLIAASELVTKRAAAVQAAAAEDGGGLKDVAALLFCCVLAACCP